MSWQIAALLFLAGGVLGLHLWWARRFAQSREQSRRELERVEQRSRDQYQLFLAQQTALFDNLTEGLLLLNSDGRVELANHCCTSIFGIAGEVRGLSLIEALRIHELSTRVDSLTARQPALRFELRLAHPSDRWLQVNGAAVFDAQGARQATILVFHDLTRVKQLERTRADFIANISHELRTPLSLLKGCAETLLDGAKDNPEVATRFLQTIDRNAERLSLLIEDLLTISESESGHLRLNLQLVSLRSAVEKNATDFKDRALAKQITFSNRVPDLSLRADPDRLDQVLCNLFDNAIKYGRTGGSVIVEARPLEELSHVEIVVRDDGPGIPSEAIGRIFERFFRVDKARSRDQGGTGLGLAIVKHMVQNHGGKVWAHSQPGTGLAIYFTLPRAAAQDHRGADSPAPTH